MNNLSETQRQEAENELANRCLNTVGGWPISASLHDYLVDRQPPEETVDLPGKMSALIFRLNAVIPKLEPYPNLLQDLRNRIRALAIELTECDQFSYVMQICEASGVGCDMLADHARKHGIMYKDRAHSDLVMALQEHGTADDIDRVFAQDPLTPEHPFCDDKTHDKVTSKLSAISDLVNDYLAQSGLAKNRSSICSQRLFPTAALQVSQMDYDLVVGVHHKGMNLPNYLRPLGQNVASFDWRRSGEYEARWRDPEQTQRMEPGMKVLVCEDDAVTGSTLQQVKNKLAELNPTSIDVCLTGVHYEKSQEAVQNVGGFDRIFHIAEFDQSQVYSDMLKYRFLLDAALNQKKVA
jgi:hypothetical protein